MKDDADTVLTDRQAHEDTMMAQVEAGLVAGNEAMNLETLQDIEVLRGQLMNDEVSIVLYRVPKDQAKGGLATGLATGCLLGGLADVALNKVALAFDGWANDPRELWEVPEVLDFCRGLVGEPGSLQCRAVLAVLVDEAGMAIDSEGNLVHPDAFQLAGSLWVSGMAFSEEVHVRNPSSPSGWDRDIMKAAHYRDALYDGEQS